MTPKRSRSTESPPPVGLKYSRRATDAITGNHGNCNSVVSGNQYDSPSTSTTPRFSTNSRVVDSNERSITHYLVPSGSGNVNSMLLDNTVDKRLNLDETSVEKDPAFLDTFISRLKGALPSLAGEYETYVREMLTTRSECALAQMLGTFLRFTTITPKHNMGFGSASKSENARIDHRQENSYLRRPAAGRRDIENALELARNEPSTPKCQTPRGQNALTQTNLSINPETNWNPSEIKQSPSNSDQKTDGDINTKNITPRTMDDPKTQKNEPTQNSNTIMNCTKRKPRLNQNIDTSSQINSALNSTNFETHITRETETMPKKSDLLMHKKDSITDKNDITSSDLVLSKPTEIYDLTQESNLYKQTHMDLSPMDLIRDCHESSYSKDLKREMDLTAMDLTLDSDDEDDVTCIDGIIRKIDHITAVHEQRLLDDDEDIANLFPEISMSQKPARNDTTVAVKEEPATRSVRGGRQQGARGSRLRGRGSRGRGRRQPRERPDGDESLNTAMEALRAVNNPLFTRTIQLPKVKPAEEDEEIGAAETYAEYTPAKLKIGCAHPDPVVETSSLSSVECSDITYKLSLPEETIRGGLLSALQLEAVVYASQAHEHVLPDGTRAGFLIGDGAGVGKGRTIAGIIFENYLKGRRRAVWVSVSNDLKYDAERDLRDIGAGSTIQVHQLSKMKYCSISSEANGPVTEGVVFSTYSSLIGRTAAAAQHFNTRLKQIIHWCGPEFDGCIVFDECHRAKNLCPVKTKLPSKTGKAVVELQIALPKARLVYASATGASEPKNMAYMVRLGIWGKGTPFNSFHDFLGTVEKRGVGAMEIVAMDMKLRGMYIARQLSFHGVTFKIEEVPLSEAFRDTYDKAVALWVEAKRMFEDGLSLLNPSQKYRIVTWSQFWGAHQRFFKYLCIAAKVKCVVVRTREALAAGKCVVIGLQSTGEARTLDQLERDDGTLMEFICTARGVFQSVVEKQFPDPDNMKPEDLQDSPSANVTQQVQEMKKDLLEKISELGKRLPPNTLDELLDQLGGTEKVAEMTGRKGRVVQTDNGAIRYESRSEGDIPLEMLNMAEKQRFMDGDKNIAIISEAASSGISLQSDRRARNQRRRVHITLELPWSADRAIQQFGRTHRSNQVNAPEYIFLISDLAGERRFASTVAKRLESLGALTHGDRRATETRDLSQFNIENKFGRETLMRLKQSLGGMESTVPLPQGYEGDFLHDAPEALKAVGVGGATDQDGDVQRFMNRLLGVPVKLQNALFQYFTDTFDAVVQEAKRNGRYDPGIQDLGSADDYVHRVACIRFVWRHATGTAPVELHTVRAERGLEWSRAEGLSNTLTDPHEGFYLSRARWNDKHNAILLVANTTSHHTSGDRLYNMYRPNMGLLPRPEPLSEIRKNYVKCSRAAAAGPWSAHHEQALTVCTHKYWRGTCSNNGCEVGLRVRTYYVLSGSVLSVWAGLDRIRMQVVRVKTDRGDKIVGTLLPKGCIELLTDALKKEAISFTEQTFQ